MEQITLVAECLESESAQLREKMIADFQRGNPNARIVRTSIIEQEYPDLHFEGKKGPQASYRLSLLVEYTLG